MNALTDILYKVPIRETVGDMDQSVRSIQFDSRKVEKGDCFVAVVGATVDGHEYMQKAIDMGAVVIVAERLPETMSDGVTYIKVEDSHEALGQMASNFFDNPSRELQLIGITGTNGKTTTVTLLHELFTLMGYKAGKLSTVENKIGDEVIPSTHTTPDPVSLNELLARMVEEGCDYCFMEVSSHAVDQRRIAGLDFDVAGFTNLSRDHLDYHPTFADYRDAKKRFFDELKSGSIALFNHDDKNGSIMVQNTHAKVLSYGLKSLCDFHGKILENGFSGLVMNIDGQEFWSKLIGSFNAYNLLLVYGVAVALDFDKLDVLTHLSKLGSVEGRFEYSKSKSGVISIVDYAHTPDALENVLKTIKDIRTQNEKVLTVVGCGGDRDKGKRPLMAKIAATLSNQVILTSDNPRTENPEQIIQDMKAGLDVVDQSKSLAITDRREAIKVACTMAQPGDIILVAGKGHEKYQDINGVKHHFDDFEELNNTFKQLDK
ncbi:MAG: UDP-N-acetylmuramoyl-L-alanyl-D-glutamate--2,6-diaminopimelate ligase [Crocinitomicaceae bacterium]